MAVPLYMSEHVPAQPTLSIREAAQYFGVGETTIRRRIQNGELRAFKLPTRGGFEWRVYIPEDAGGGVATTGGGVGSTSGGGVAAYDIPMPDTATFDGGGITTTGGGSSASDLQAEAVANVLADELQRLHDQNRWLQDQNIQLAGQLGFVQAQLQAAQEQIRLLTAEKEPEEERPAAQPEPEPPSEPRSPLWQWVRRRLSRT